MGFGEPVPGASAKADLGEQEAAKGMIIASKTFREGAIYLYQRADFKKPTWLCRIKVPNTKGFVTRSTSTGDEHIPQFSEDDATSLRKARKKIAGDISYLGLELPKSGDLPRLVPRSLPVSRAQSFCAR